MRSIPPALVAGIFFLAGRRPAGMLAARSVALEKPSMSMPFSMTPTLPEAHSGNESPNGKFFLQDSDFVNPGERA
jgi:hypothetical protein